MSHENEMTQNEITQSDIGAELATLADTQFAITDARGANWLVRKINESREYARRVDEWAAEEKARAAQVEKGLLERFGEQLETFARQAIEEQPGRARKSLNLPGGTIGFRAQPVRLRVVEEDVVIEWARGNLPGAIRVTERISKTDLNAHFEQNGEMPPGTALDAEAEKFYVK